MPGKVINKHACFLIVLIFTAGMLFLFAPQKVMANIASGTYQGLSWRITDDGELILGNGGTQTLTANTNRWLTWPWYNYRLEIKKVTATGNIIMRGSMQSMFYGEQNLTDIDITAINTSQATQMGNVFQYCLKLEHIDLSHFDTQNARDLGGLFQGCIKLKELDVSGFNTSKVTSLANMFYDCRVLSKVDVSTFDTRNVTNIRQVFYMCKKLEALDLSAWNTGKVTDMSSLFLNCESLISLNISSFSSSRTTTMQDMFSGCSNLKEIQLGDNWSFKGNNISSETNQALLPTPTDNMYSGKWIREDDTFGPYTPKELRDNYASTMAGTWVWEERPTNTVVFNGPEGYSGAMANDTMYVGIDYEIPVCQFRLFNHHFTYWDDGQGNIYGAQDVITDGIYEDGSVITLTAVFEQDNNDASFSGGEADVYLIGGEKIELPDLPGGTGYQIWEETPSGWQLVDQSDPAGVIPPNDTAAASFTNEYVPGTPTIQLIATKTLDGQIPAAEAYQFELVDQNGEVIETVANTETGVVMFSTLTFHQPGEIDYTIREVRGEDPRINYDTHQENVHISVTDDGAGNLTAMAAYDSDGLAFVNETKPGMLTVAKQTDGGGDPDEVFTFRIKVTDDYGRSLDSVSIVSPDD